MQLLVNNFLEHNKHFLNYLRLFLLLLGLEFLWQYLSVVDNILWLSDNLIMCYKQHLYFLKLQLVYGEYSMAK
ncbi:hypothetical protein D5R40_02990 [Okeania hirsuta]|uniref:Uncharacterized protein n=1 Tax=Okeania hirsuta TaxID=1458930 RepID=A0A3N6RQI7_9CYAN|nr:hypothetical protein D5R40_02990 [Okeania hirsuta]